MNGPVVAAATGTTTITSIPYDPIWGYRCHIETAVVAAGELSCTYTEEFISDPLLRAVDYDRNGNLVYWFDDYVVADPVQTTVELGITTTLSGATQETIQSSSATYTGDIEVRLRLQYGDRHHTAGTTYHRQRTGHSTVSARETIYDQSISKAVTDAYPVFMSLVSTDLRYGVSAFQPYSSTITSTVTGGDGPETIGFSSYAIDGPNIIIDYAPGFFPGIQGTYSTPIQVQQYVDDEESSYEGSVGASEAAEFIDRDLHRGKPNTKELISKVWSVYSNASTRMAVSPTGDVALQLAVSSPDTPARKSRYVTVVSPHDGRGGLLTTDSTISANTMVIEGSAQTFAALFVYTTLP
jgi:hypothetical protein